MQSQKEFFSYAEIEQPWIKEPDTYFSSGGRMKLKADHYTSFGGVESRPLHVIKKEPEPCPPTVYEENRRRRSSEKQNLAIN